MNKTLKSFFKNKKNQQLWFLICPYKTYKIVGHLKELSSSIRLKKKKGYIWGYVYHENEKP